MYRMHEIYPDRYRKCPKCVGKGRIVCPTCKGRHEIQRIREGVSGQVLEFSPCPNPKCAGRGTIECPNCKGTGDQER
jgi:DnaJ-class molecular chaperone